jgi:hypothetical protein
VRAKERSGDDGEVVHPEGEERRLGCGTQDAGADEDGEGVDHRWCNADEIPWRWSGASDLCWGESCGREREDGGVGLRIWARLMEDRHSTGQDSVQYFNFLLSYWATY